MCSCFKYWWEKCTSLVPLTRRCETARLCSWMSCSRVMRNFLSCPSWTQKGNDVMMTRPQSDINDCIMVCSCVLHFQSVPAEVQWSSSDHQPPDCESKSRSCRRAERANIHIIRSFTRVIQCCCFRERRAERSDTHRKTPADRKRKRGFSTR